jgi:hypothetical protein
MTQKFLIVPTSDLDGNTQPTTLDNAFLDDASISNMTNGVSYRAFALNNFGGAFTPSSAGITRLATTQVISSASVDQTSFTSGGTFTAAAGSNRMVTLWVFTRSTNSSATTPLDLSASWGAQAFTRVGQSGSNASNRPWVALFRIAETNIPAGANSITITDNAAANNISRCLAYLVEYSNVNQTTPFGTFVGTSSGSSSVTTQAPTVSMTATTSLLLTMAAHTSASASPYTLSAGTEVFDANISTGGGAQGAEELVGATGNRTHTHTASASGQMAGFGVEMFRA